jgi:hypothetical protein
MVQLIARKPLIYAGRRYPAGVRFEASGRDALLLQAVKSAELAPIDKGSDAPPKRKRGRPRKHAAETPMKTPHPVPPPVPEREDDDDTPLEPPDEDDAPPDEDHATEQPPGQSPTGRSTGTLRAKKRTYKRRDLHAER